MADIFDINLLNHFVDKHKKYIKSQIMYSCCIVITGIIVITIGFFLSNIYNNDAFKLIMTFGGTFVVSLCSFPFKEIFSRYGKISDIRYFINNYLSKFQVSMESAGTTQILKIYEKIIDKNVG